MAVPGLRNRPVWRRCDMLCTSGPPIICQIMATKVGNLLKLICRSRASTRSGVKSHSAKKPYIPKTCVQKAHSWDVDYPPEMIPVPPKISLLGQFLGLQNPFAEIQKILMSVFSGTPIHACYFKRGRNRCKIGVRKAALYW